MNKRGSTELMILGLIAVIAVVGLVMVFTGVTGKTGAQPQTRQVLPTEEEFRIERPGGYNCECSGQCVYDQRTESAVTPVTMDQRTAISNCRNTIEARCKPQNLINFKYGCQMR